ncbi:hypothetical protein DND132_2137 [Pseudodesulfovibrio mercurii]|uniref:Uncharacterized protein n=1 Tax=Pseudodesulfovibrio mercurii TaxID=641491 RepID=F0JHV6_9BACT|nr:hypothetical protein [Pseudodesulfovibrio mercurii]EGB15342.1 hypothetical protein DND132_2137 [Pseudodesulfovibrio mercurii]
MGNVVALDEFRRALDRREERGPVVPRPEIRGAEIWGRDYRQLEAVVFGLLKVREIAAYHASLRAARHADGSGRAFDQLCLNALDAAYHVEDRGPARLKAAVKPLKEWLLDAMTEDNKRDMAWALVLVDLIEKSPSK